MDDGGAGRVKLLYASDATRGLGIYQSDLSGVATGVVNFHYQGTGGGSRFVISRGNTGGAEIELENANEKLLPVPLPADDPSVAAVIFFSSA